MEAATVDIATAPHRTQPPPSRTVLTATDVAGQKLLTASDVAIILEVPVGWVYAATRARRIPTVRLGRYYRYRRSAIDAWIVAQER
jgi:excisionase family DNA binding protein